MEDFNRDFKNTAQWLAILQENKNWKLMLQDFLLLVKKMQEVILNNLPLDSVMISNKCPFNFKVLDYLLFLQFYHLSFQ